MKPTNQPTKTMKTAMNKPNQTANSVSIRACQYTGAVSIQPLKNGNIMMRQAGVSIYRKTHLLDAFNAISKECDFPESLETEVRGNINFQRLPM